MCCSPNKSCPFVQSAFAGPLLNRLKENQGAISRALCGYGGGGPREIAQVSFPLPVICVRDPWRL